MCWCFLEIARVRQLFETLFASLHVCWGYWMRSFLLQSRILRRCASCTLFSQSPLLFTLEHSGQCPILSCYFLRDLLPLAFRLCYLHLLRSCMSFRNKDLQRLDYDELVVRAVRACTGLVWQYNQESNYWLEVDCYISASVLFWTCLFLGSK